MDARAQNALSHSAQVRMELRLSGLVLPISHLGPNFLIVNVPIDHPPADAEISMAIDGHEKHWAIRLPEGISTALQRTTITRRQSSNGSTVIP